MEQQELKAASDTAGLGNKPCRRIQDKKFGRGGFEQVH
jgi:hypothetical protein